MDIVKKIDDYLKEQKMKGKNKKKEKSLVDRIRKPTAPPTSHHGDKSKYNRKKKHKGKKDEKY